jgi:hypothetical protein
MSATRNRLVDQYLAELRAALRDMPRKQREELIADVSSHLEATIPLGAADADVLNALDRFGDPEQIAEAERERLGLDEPRAGWLEWLAIPLLLVGGVVVPVLGWILGAVFLWLSRCWTLRDKLVGTLIVPGGLLPALYFVLAAGSVETCTSVTNTQGATVTQHCTGGHSTVGQVALIVAWAVLALAPIATAIYLGRRLPRRR